MTKKNKKNMAFLLQFFLLLGFLVSVPVGAASALETRYWDEYIENKDKFVLLKDHYLFEWGDCPTIAQATAEADGEWWSKPLKVVVDASVATGENIFNAVAGGAEKLMVTAGALWMALFILKMYNSLQEPDPMDMFQKFGVLMFKIGVASWLLRNYGWFFEYIVSTPIQIGAGFVASSAGAAASQVSGLSLDDQMRGLSTLKDTILELADSAQDVMADLEGKADVLLCRSKVHAFTIPFSLPPLNIGPFWDPKVALMACLVTLGCFSVTIVIMFQLIDTCFRVGILVALSPLFIVAWVFDATRNLAGKGWSMLLHITFTLMLTKILIMIGAQLMLQTLGWDGMTDKNADIYVCKSLLFDPDGHRPPSIATTAEEKACAVHPWIDSMWLAFLAAVVYTWFLMIKPLSELTSHFSGASFSNDTAFEGAKGALKIANGAVHAGGAVKDGVKGGIKAVGNRISEHKDKAAARTVVEDAKQRATNANYKPDAKQQQKIDDAKKRLQKKGIMGQNGQYDLPKMLALTENGKARTAMRATEKIKNFTLGRFNGESKHFSKTDIFADKSDDAMKYLNRDPKSSASSTSASSSTSARAPMANYTSTRAQSAESMAKAFDAERSKQTYDLSTKKGKDQKNYDDMQSSNLHAQAAYEKKCEADPAYAASKEGMAAKARIQSNDKLLGDLKNQGYANNGVMARAQDRRDNDIRAAGAAVDTANKFNASIANQNYPDTEQGRNQKTYDQLTGSYLDSMANYRKKVAADSTYSDSAEGKADVKKLYDDRAALAECRKEYGVKDTLKGNGIALSAVIK